MKRVAVLFCVELIGCASPSDEGPGFAEAPPRDTISANRTDVGLQPGTSERPPADPDFAHFIQIDNDGRGLQAEEGSAEEGGWTIHYRVVNPAEPSVYLVGCNNPPMPQLQKWLGGAWTPVHDVIDDACRSPAWEIKGGDTLPASSEWSKLRVVYEPGTHPGTEGDATRRGTYRLVTTLFTDDPDVDIASATQIVGSSTQFVID